MPKKNDEHLKVVEQLAHKYYDGNAKKNEGATEERKAKASLESEVANYGETVVVKINDKAYLEIGYADIEKEEIDPKKFLENYPDLFWELVTIPKTAVQSKLGDKEVALNSRTVHQNEFKIIKHKSKPV